MGGVAYQHLATAVAFAPPGTVLQPALFAVYLARLACQPIGLVTLPPARHVPQESLKQRSKMVGAISLAPAPGFPG